MGMQAHDMSLTKEDLRQIAEVVDDRSDRSIDRIADAVTEKLEANSLGDMKRDIAGMKGDITGLKEDVASMGEDVAKIPLIEAEIRQINQNIAALREHAGI